MKKIINTILILSIVFATQQATAQNYKTALGIRLSTAPAMVNNSLSVKHFINEKVAVEGLLSFGDPISFGALVEFHKPLSAEGLNYFYGGGAYLGFEKVLNVNTQKTVTNTNVGAMGIVGLDYKFPSFPHLIQVFTLLD